MGIPTEKGKMIRFFIPYRLPGLNEMIAAAKVRKGGWSKYADEKRKHTRNIANIIGSHKTFVRVFINFRWMEPDRRRDPDNIAVGRKFIFDAMVDRKIISGDGWRHIEGWTDTFCIDKDNPGVEVTVCEVTDTQNVKSADQK